LSCIQKPGRVEAETTIELSQMPPNPRQSRPLPVARPE